MAMGGAATDRAGGAADIALRDGTTVGVRPACPQDAAGLRRLFEGLSAESRYLRFFSAAVDVPLVVGWAADVDQRRRGGLVAVAGPQGRIVAHAGWERERDHPERAEVALVIDDDFQGRGLGTILLGQLAVSARGRGVELLVAEVLPGNHPMIQVFRDSGFDVRVRSLSGVLLVEIPTLLTPDALARFDEREEQAAAAALRRVLAPRSVAVIGASRRRGTVGAEVFHNLLAAGFTGPVYPVNPRAAAVQSVPAYAAVGQIAGPVDLAVLAVPAERVVEVARACAAKGVGALVVLSAGFAESGPRGAERQDQLLGVCRQAGMRLVGPNCLGVLNTDPKVRLDATFGPTLPRRGRVGFGSQSGALGLAIVDYANQLGLGLSSFVSMGNKADLSGNDLLGYWQDDPGTDMVLLYLESFGNPRKFARFASRLARSKPIVAVKAGRSVAGVRASSSHTGALLAASDLSVDALFRQAGVIRTDTLGELFDVAKLLAAQPAPKGRRVAVVTNAGGPGILCADACEAVGLRVPAFSQGLRSRLAGVLPAEAAAGNPVDLLAAAPPERYGQAIGLVAASGEADAVVVIHVPPLAGDQGADRVAGDHHTGGIAAAIRRAAAQAPPGVTMLAAFMRPGEVPPELRDGSRQIPCYQFPEEAARALARAADRGQWLRRPEGRVPAMPGTRQEEAAAILADALAGGPRWLTIQESATLLDCYRLPLAPWRLVRTPEQAGAAASRLGGPVAVKAVVPGLLHKTEAGAVRLGLRGPSAVTRATAELTRALEAAGQPPEGFLVQPMVSGVAELLVGVVNDPTFGPLVAVGAGGTSAEPLGDVTVRLAPLTDRDATGALHELKTFPLLDGWRGTPKADQTALEDLLLRVGILADNHPEIAELDCNPVIAGPDGATIVDVRIRVELPPPALPVSARLR
jgi:acetyl coenzyme A synthetase (ADP forming)-like protein